MVVSILGGSAPSTGWLIEWLARECPGLGLTIRLAGRTTRHLEAVTRACRLLAARSSLRIESFLEPVWPRALAGAEVVLIQFRAGGMAGRRFDETFPLQSGVAGDEGLGPGGLSAAVRTWPLLRKTLELIERHAPPTALPLLLTSPAGLLIQAAGMTFPQLPLTAICELPFTTLQQLRRGVKEDGCELAWSYTGVNHLGWLYDETGEITRQYAAGCASPAMAQAALRYRGAPLKYLRLHFEPDAVIAEQLRCGPRADELMRLSAQALTAFESENLAGVRAALSIRPAPWYTEAIGPLLHGLAGGVERRPFFLTRCESAERCEERAYRLEAGRFIALSNLSPPALIRAMTHGFLIYEQAAALAVVAPDPDTIREALRLHPWIASEGVARSLARQIVSSRAGECEQNLRGGASTMQAGPLASMLVPAGEVCS